MSALDAAGGLAAVQVSGAAVTRYFDALGIVEIKIDPSLVGQLRQDPHVDFVEPVDNSDYPIGSTVGTSLRTRARDLARSLFSEDIPDNVDSVKAPLAWPYSTGSGARLLVIDTGHDRGHEDLPFVPLGNCSGPEGGCDDALPNPHGTQVSGVALARQNNGVGVVGVAPGVAAADIFYWGVCDNAQPGNCDSGDIVDALNWSVNSLGPRGVINVSIAGSCNVSKAMAVSGAYNAGHVLVAGVGNNGINEQLCIAKYSQVIAVAGINPNKTFAIPSTCNPNFPGSSWGSHVDVVAPYQVFTTSLGNSYITVCGTSVSDPAMAGVALLVRARYPSWTNGQVRDRILFTTEPLGPPGCDDHFGYGLVRAHLAVAFDPPTVTPSVVGGKPKLTWNVIPFAAQYHICRSITPTACPTWELYATTTGTTFTDFSTPVTSFYGYSPPPSQTAVNYYVVAVHSDGTYSTSSAPPAFLTVSSNPPC